MEKGSPLDRELLGKTIWEWMQVLFVPLAIAIVGIIFSIAQSCTAQSVEQQRVLEQQAIEDRRAQAAAYQAYLDEMSRLLTEEHLSSVPEERVRRVARAQTLTVLSTVEKERKLDVLRFLAENKLIQEDEPVINLQTADLRGAKFEELKSLFYWAEPNVSLEVEPSEGAIQLPPE